MVTLLSLEAVEIPLRVVPANTKGLHNTLEKLVLLQEILYTEEKMAYMNSLDIQFGYTYSTGSVLHSSSQNHPLVQMHSAAVYQKSLCRLLELETLPLLHMLQQRHQHNVEKVNLLLSLH